jgi:hypothetical protein
MVTPHPLGAAAVEARAEELRARAAQHRSVKLSDGDTGRTRSRRSALSSAVRRSLWAR